MSDISPLSFVANALFNGTFPKLTNLGLKCCDTNWKSPLLKDPLTLQILRPSARLVPRPEDRLDALDEISQLETLHPIPPPQSVPSMSLSFPSLGAQSHSPTSLNSGSPLLRRVVRLHSLTSYCLLSPYCTCLPSPKARKPMTYEICCQRCPWATGHGTPSEYTTQRVWQYKLEQ